MESLSEDEFRQVLGEVVADQVKAILEYVSEIPAIKLRLDSIESRLDSLENEFKPIKTLALQHDMKFRKAGQVMAAV